MSTTPTTEPYVVPAAHTAPAASLQDSLKDALTRHVTIAHALRTKHDAVSEHQVSAWEDAHASTFQEIAQSLAELRRVEDAATWIAEHAHDIRVEG